MGDAAGPLPARHMALASRRDFTKQCVFEKFGNFAKQYLFAIERNLLKQAFFSDIQYIYKDTV
jgi:hypothetical protein